MQARSMSVLVAGITGLALFVRVQSADAFTLPAPSELAAAHDQIAAVEQVRTVCDKEWDGYQWQDRCRTTGSRHYHHHYGSAQVRRLQRRLLYYMRHYYY